MTSGKREKFNRLENNPGMFKGFENGNTFQHPDLLHLMTQHAPRKASDPTPAAKRLAYERRSFIKETKSALKKAAKPNLAQNEFLSHFEEFHRVVVHFHTNGKFWPKTTGLILRADEVTQLQSLDQCQEWVLTVKAPNGKDYNWYHPDWSNSLLRQQFQSLTESEKVRIKSFMTNFLEYTRCQQQRHKVKTFYTNQGRFQSLKNYENFVQIEYFLKESGFQPWQLEADNVDEIDSWPKMMKYMLKLL